MSAAGLPDRQGASRERAVQEAADAVSVVVTVWRGRKQFLLQALESVPRRAGFPSELIVAADFHDDALERQVRGRNGTWVVSNETHLGAKIAAGVRAARGSVVAFLEDDDLFHPDRLEQIHRAFAEDPELGFYHNAQRTFPDGVAPAFPVPLPVRPLVRVPAGRRTNEDCERVWTLGAGYNASSTAMRRDVLEPHLGELATMRVGIAPYLFYRAWCSGSALVMDARPLTAVRLHAANTTPNRLQGRRARFTRLATIAADLSADARTILSFLPAEVWDIPLQQMTSMAEILTAVQDADGSPRPVARASLELLRRRRSWLPRWTILSLAVTCMGSRRGARALYRWLTAVP